MSETDSARPADVMRPKHVGAPIKRSEDPRLLTPRTFGLGWAVNVGRIVALATKQG